MGARRSGSSVIRSRLARQTVTLKAISDYTDRSLAMGNRTGPAIATVNSLLSNTFRKQNPPSWRILSF